MQVLTRIELFAEICRTKKKYGMMFIHSREEWDREKRAPEDIDYYVKVLKALPFITLEYYQTIIDGTGFLLFDTEEEMLSNFNGIIRSPELPRIYALIFYPDGNLGEERKR